MSNNELLDELKKLIETFQRNREWGLIEVAFQAGEAALIRKETTRKLQQENNRYERQTYR